jgi:hypothetical protein
MQTKKTYLKTKNERGSSLVEASIMLTIIIAIATVALDVLTFSRYAGTAQWLSTVAARVSAVETPADELEVPPAPELLKLPRNTSIPYLSSYEQAPSPVGCGGRNRLTENHLRTLNLTLGELNRVMKTKAKTISTWTDSAKVGQDPLPGEFYVVPTNCALTNESSMVKKWKVCVAVPQLLLGKILSCHYSNAI